jgi:hypothetical protein
MSETNFNQEQPQAPAEQAEVESATNEQPAPQTEQENSSVYIGGQVIEKNEDGTETQTVFPVTEGNTEAPVESAPEPAPAEAEAPVAPEPVAITETAASPVEAEVTVLAPTELIAQKDETQTIAEVGVPKELPNQPEAIPAKVGVAGSLALIAAGVGHKIFRHGK